MHEAALFRVTALSGVSLTSAPSVRRVKYWRPRSRCRSPVRPLPEAVGSRRWPCRSRRASSRGTGVRFVDLRRVAPVRDGPGAGRVLAWSTRRPRPSSGAAASGTSARQGEPRRRGGAPRSGSAFLAPPQERGGVAAANCQPEPPDVTGHRRVASRAGGALVVRPRRVALVGLVVAGARRTRPDRSSAQEQQRASATAPVHQPDRAGGRPNGTSSRPMPMHRRDRTRGRCPASGWRHPSGEACRPR